MSCPFITWGVGNAGWGRILWGWGQTQWGRSWDGERTSGDGLGQFAPLYS